MPVTINGTTGIAGPDGSASTPAVQGTDSNTGLFYPAADTVALSTGGSERMRITSAGLVSIGTTSAYSTLNVGGASGAKVFYTGGTDANSSGVLVLGDGNRSTNYVGVYRGEALTTGTLASLTLGAYEHIAFRCDTAVLGSQVERMRITNTGNLLVGTTSTSLASATTGTGLQYIPNNAVIVAANGGNSCLIANKTDSTTGSTAIFRYNGSTVGDISITSTNAAYNTASSSTNGAQLNYQGITFPATQSASSDANTLDDYEEGTWTPTLTGASSDPTVTYTTQTGQYTKVGRVVHVQCSIVPATYSGGSGVLRIAGLPFTSGSSTFYVTGSAYLEGVDIGASRTWATSYVAPGVSYIRVITSQNNGAASDVLVGGVSAGDNFIIGITYMV